MKKLVAISALVLALSVAPKLDAAGTNGYGQYGQYGVGGRQAILIDKTVATSVETKGGQLNFVDNLSPSDARFHPGDTVTFRLKVKNTADTKLNDVEVRDFLPSSLELPAGQGVLENNAFVIRVGNLNPGEEKEYTLKARVKSQDKLPADRGVFCEINRSRVQSGNVSDEDTAQFCIEKQIQGAPKEVPQAGPGAGILLMVSQLGLLGTGIYLKKRS